MPAYVPVTHKDTTIVAAGMSNSIPFGPVPSAGEIHIVSTPVLAGISQPHSETGRLGLIVLHRVGTSQPVASSPPAPLGATQLVLDVNVTQVTTDRWSCTVHNLTDVDLEFDTVITYPSATVAVPRTATFDLGLLNLLLAEAIADTKLAMHVQTSAGDFDPQSSVGWSEAVANSLPAPYRGQNAYRFAVPNHRDETDLPTIPGTTITWLVVAASADPDPVAPVQAIFAEGDRGPAVRVTVTLNPNSVRVWAVDSDVDLDKLQPVVVRVAAASVELVLYLNELGQYGNPWDINPDIRLFISVAGAPLPPNWVIDPLVEKINTGVRSIDRTLIQQYVNGFFAALMRLVDPLAMSYSVDGDTLTVSYLGPETPPPPVPAPVRPAATAANLASKVDHVVVVMMENRSFDHMLGYLSLPASSGGRGRTDVDGLKGDEFNYDTASPPNVQRVHLRHAPNARNSETSFLTDPGHGWPEVTQQLSGDPGVPLDVGNPSTFRPPLVSNAGFVKNFAAKILSDRQSLPPRLETLTVASVQVDPGTSHAVTFQPGFGGAINASVSSPGATGVGGAPFAIISVYTGGNAVLHPTASGGGAGMVWANFQATTQDVTATPNAWKCVVRNETSAALTCSISVTFVAEEHDSSNQELPDAVMSYYNAAHLPVYDFLAENFAICDRWYASLPTDTWPNRLYAMSGGSGGLTLTPSDAAVEKNPPGYLLRSIFQVLQEHGVDWNIFFSDLPFGLIFTPLAQDAAYTARMRGVDDFLQRAAAGTLPALSWIDPNFQDVPDDPRAASDDHPPGDVCRGQNLIASIYNAIARGPAWSKTLLVVTYDEHGGFYDHVLPPATIQVVVRGDQGGGSGPTHTTVAGDAAGHTVAAFVHPPGGRPEGPPDDNPGLHMYGLRVPAFVVSPWVAPGSVAHQTFDHTSLLATILRRFCVAADGTVPGMGQRADHALDLDALLSAAAPSAAPLNIPPLADCNDLQGSVLTRNAFSAVLRQYLLGF